MSFLSKLFPRAAQQPAPKNETGYSGTTEQFTADVQRAFWTWYAGFANDELISQSAFVEMIDDKKIVEMTWSKPIQSLALQALTDFRNGRPENLQIFVQQSLLMLHDTHTVDAVTYALKVCINAAKGAPAPEAQVIRQLFEKVPNEIKPKILNGMLARLAFHHTAGFSHVQPVIEAGANAASTPESLANTVMQAGWGKQNSAWDTLKLLHTHGANFDAAIGTLSPKYYSDRIRDLRMAQAVIENPAPTTSRQLPAPVSPA